MHLQEIHHLGIGISEMEAVIPSTSIALHYYANSRSIYSYSDASGATSTNSVVKNNFITVFRGPIAQFDFSEDTICSGTLVTLTSTSTPGDGAITAHNWAYNDGTPDVIGNASIQHVYSNLDPTMINYPTVLSD
ncbi:MAG: hypothetical protein IPF75_00335 [Bacteroidetes bacterium]|nr:hypothetical protein [Bacteroidota bacterium]